MIVHYYIAPKASLEKISGHAHHWSWAEIDENSVILWARFADAGSEFNFRKLAGIEPLEARSNRPIAAEHAAKLRRFGVCDHHTTLDLSGCLEKTVGHCMRLPMY